MCYILLAIDIPIATYSVLKPEVYAWMELSPKMIFLCQVLQNDKPVCELFVP